MDPAVRHALIALLPVLLCLFGFERLDAFKLVRAPMLLALLASGGVIAVVAYYVNDGVLDAFPIAFDRFTRLIAPGIEESLKAAPVVILFARNRIGYMIDAGITGFAIGSGFAMAENLTFLHEFGNANLGIWIVRGFGTAIMHGGATATFATLSQMLLAPSLRVEVDRFRFNPLLFLPGLVGAIAIHMAFNFVQSAALVAMAVVLVAVPLALFFAFRQGEVYAHRWLAEDRAAHLSLLKDLRSGNFDRQPSGRALARLAGRLDPAMAGRLHAYVRANVELVVRADLTLLAHEEHRHVDLNVTLHEAFKRLHQLERALGPALVLAVRHHLRFSRDDLWKMHELEMESAAER